MDNKQDRQPQDQLGRAAATPVPEVAVATSPPEAIGAKPQAAASQAGGSPVSRILKQLAGIVLAAGFLIWAFQGIDLNKVLAAIKQIDMTWIWISVGTALLSHLLRAVRWVIMLQPLSTKRISIFNSFCAVMYGYAINLPIPRGGEVARVVAISRSEQIPWAGVVPTLLIDRLLDIALLVCSVGLTLAVLPPDLKEHFGFLVPVGVLMCLATLVGLVLLPKAASIMFFLLGTSMAQQRLPDKLKTTLHDLAGQFQEGTKSLSNPVSLSLIGILSFAIWGCYYLGFYCGLCAFNWQHRIDAVHSLIVWTIASVSVIAPTPGCIGTYHMAMKEALHVVAGIDSTQGLAFATLGHAVSFVFVPLGAAAVCFVLQNLLAVKQKAR